MTRDEIIMEKQKIIDKYGVWTAHTIHLGYDVYTRDVDIIETWRVDRYRQILKNFGYNDLSKLRILDLASCEGLFAIEFARHGAKTLGIEGRRANLEKAIFAKNVLELSTAEFVQDDVRNLNADKYGVFDVTFCCGILYHLDMPDVIRFIKKMSEVTKHLLFIDTHVSLPNLRKNPFNLSKMSDFVWEEESYKGRYYVEQGSTPEEKESALWSSLDNIRSFWLERSSLYKALNQYGFVLIYENLWDPQVPIDEIDRLNFIAVKNQNN